MGEIIAIGNVGMRASEDGIKRAHIERTLNVEEAKALFKSESVAFEYQNGVPMERAIELFDKDAVAFATRSGFPQKPQTNNQYGIGKIQMPYLTEYGFIIAATYRNVKILHEGHHKCKCNNR